MVMISTIPSIIESYQYIYFLNPKVHPRPYINLCDYVSNLVELMLSLF